MDMYTQIIIVLMVIQIVCAFVNLMEMAQLQNIISLLLKTTEQMQRFYMEVIHQVYSWSRERVQEETNNGTDRTASEDIDEYPF